MGCRRKVLFGGDEFPMTQGNQTPMKPKLFRFRLLDILLLVTVIALWLAMWRAVGPAIIFITACVPFGLLIYGSACVGARYGYPILVGAFTGVVFGILGPIVDYGLLDGGSLNMNDFAHLTTTGLAVGSSCGFIVWIKRPAERRRR